MKPIILKLNIDRGFAFYPFIIIPKRVVGTIYEIPYIVHETTHWDRQGKIGLSWVFKYFTDKKFRMNEEAIAYVNEIKSILENQTYNNVDLLIHQKAKQMETKYWKMCTYDEAVIVLTKLL